MKRRAFLGAALATLSGCSTPGVKLDAPYVVTPYAVVDEMLRLAQVRPGDMVYDLGCGDGRIVIAAAERFGARGVGVDIDPRRIAEAQAAARSAGVAERVRFAVQDLFQTDFSQASVVTLYLFPELNARLKPKFLSELEPGARIVSHQFGIAGWAPDDGANVRVGEDLHQVFLWVVPPR
jgi:SAM-dependent methyltransferase